MTSNPQPGYYADPTSPGYVMYWDGARWVPESRRAAPAQRTRDVAADGRTAESAAATGTPTGGTASGGGRRGAPRPSPGRRVSPSRVYGDPAQAKGDPAARHGEVSDSQRREAWTPGHAGGDTPPAAPGRERGTHAARAEQAAAPAQDVSAPRTQARAPQPSSSAAPQVPPSRSQAQGRHSGAAVPQAPARTPAEAAAPTGGTWQAPSAPQAAPPRQAPQSQPQPQSQDAPPRPQAAPVPAVDASVDDSGMTVSVPSAFATAALSGAPAPLVPGPAPGRPEAAPWQQRPAPAAPGRRTGIPAHVLAQQNAEAQWERADPYAAAAAPEGPRVVVLANTGSRLLARLLDMLLLIVVSAPGTVPFLVLLANHMSKRLHAVAVNISTPQWKPLFSGVEFVYFAGAIGVMLVVGLLYEAISLRMRGQTLGKRLAGLRIVGAGGDDYPTAGQAVGRALLYYVLAAIPVVDVFNVLALTWSRPYRQCWHDRVARTMVVRV